MYADEVEPLNDADRLQQLLDENATRTFVRFQRVPERQDANNYSGQYRWRLSTPGQVLQLTRQAVDLLNDELIGTFKTIKPLTHVALSDF